MNKKRIKIVAVLVCAVVFLSAVWHLHPSFVWTQSASQNFSQVQLAMLEFKLRRDHFIDLDNDKTIYAEYDEDLTRSHIDSAIRVSKCGGEESYCVQGDALYAAYKKYGRKNIAIVNMRWVRADGQTKYTTFYFAWCWVTWILFETGE
ncbi:hypothetical protein [Alloscardovia omnicolens]|uniref:hypothetical protein n=1 Tax=Alloscardovia omnicolens TaxID=419015 RepID=UPI003A638FDD